MISESSLVCFLDDLRNALCDFREEMPKGIHFINMDSFYFYVNLAFPVKRQEIGGLMGILGPFIPVIVSEINLMSLLAAYASGDMAGLARLEESLIERSQLSFIQTAIYADCHNWGSLVNTCRKVHRQRLSFL